jgi:formylglycine-generating enzyme required for sulfatase activity
MYIAADKAKREELMYPAVRTVDQWIKDNGAQTILYLTWVHPGPIREDEFDVYFDEQTRLTEGYLEIAQELGALVAPAGIAFENALQQQSDIYLWFEGDDAGHASGMGQYLTAAVFYALIYQESPEGLGFLPKPEDTARFMQTIAAETVLTNPIPTTTDSTPTASTVGETWIRPTDGMVMLYIPEGEFEIGSTESEIQAAVGECKRDRGQEHCDISWFEDETPLHSVSLPAYWIDQTEVTNAQYAAFLNEQDNQHEGGAYWLDIEESQIELVGDSFQPLEGYAEHPVVEVTWYGARAYCKWIGGQLPTEEQWEYAARGPERNIYPWGDAEPTCALANYAECQGSTLPVGNLPDGVSWSGAKDMGGNAWEWAYNWYLPYPGNDIENEDYGKIFKVIRGGSWNLEAYYMRTPQRNLEYTPDVSLEHIGFRCVIPIDD